MLIDSSVRPNKVAVTELTRFGIDPVTALGSVVVSPETPDEFAFGAHVRWAHDTMGSHPYENDDTERTDLERVASVPGRGIGNVVLRGADVSVWQPQASFITRPPDAERFVVSSRNMGNATYTEVRPAGPQILATPEIAGIDSNESTPLLAVGIVTTEDNGIAVVGRTVEGETRQLFAGNAAAAQKFGWGVFQGLTDVHRTVVS